MFYYIDENGYPLLLEHEVNSNLYPSLVPITQQQYDNLTTVPEITDEDRKNELKAMAKIKLQETDWVFNSDTGYYLSDQTKLEVMNYRKKLRKLIQDIPTKTYQVLNSEFPVMPSIEKENLNDDELTLEDIVENKIVENSSIIDTLLVNNLKNLNRI